MPYVRNYRRTYRRPARTARRIIRGKPRATKNKAAIYQLTRKVNRIQKKVNARTLHATFSKTGDFNVSNAVSNFGYQQIICPVAATGNPAWAQVFDLDTSVQFLSTLKIKSIHMEYKVYSANEESPIDTTVVLMAPKSRKVLEESLNFSTGQLTLQTNKDYINNAGCVLVNLQRWKLHYYKRHITVAQDGLGELEFPMTRNLGKIKKTNLNWTIKNRNGNWNQVSPNDLPVHQRLFIVTFNNNSFADLESPGFKHSTIVKCTAHQ